MDSNSPEYYCESREDSVRETREFIEYTKRVGGGFVKPVITPRFAPSCSAELLGDLGQLVKDDGCLMQTHISETKAECSWVSSIFEGKGYGQVYDDAGLLGPGSIMAHCIHLSETEIARFIEVDAGISHCPTSNLMLESGILDLRALFDRGILKIGLGTDVAGGFSPSILEAMRHAILSSKALKITKGAEYLAIGFVEAFWMATRGGARVLGVEKNIGGFEVGKEFDVLEIEMGSGRGRVDLFEEGAMGMLEKFVYLGSEANIVDVWVGGRKVV
jgi:guanine deaminase